MDNIDDVYQNKEFSTVIISPKTITKIFDFN